MTRPTQCWIHCNHGSVDNGGDGRNTAFTKLFETHVSHSRVLLICFVKGMRQPSSGKFKVVFFNSVL